jgi:hypothetical protein
VGLCTEFPSLSWLAASPEKALSGIRRVVGEVVAEMTACGEGLLILGAFDCIDLNSIDV